jgi:hypothetical protein
MQVRGSDADRAGENRFRPVPPRQASCPLRPEKHLVLAALEGTVGFLFPPRSRSRARIAGVLDECSTPLSEADCWGSTGCFSRCSKRQYGRTNATHWRTTPRVRPSCPMSRSGSPPRIPSGCSPSSRSATLSGWRPRTYAGGSGDCGKAIGWRTRPGPCSRCAAPAAWAVRDTESLGWHGPSPAIGAHPRDARRREEGGRRDDAARRRGGGRDHRVRGVRPARGGREIGGAVPTVP